MKHNGSCTTSSVCAKRSEKSPCLVHGPTAAQFIWEPEKLAQHQEVFIVAPQFAKNITGVTSHSHRLAVLTASLSKDIDVFIVQVYASTADKEEEEHDGFYNELEDLVHSLKTSYIVVMGDFNARVGPRKAGEASIGPNSSEERNEAGERLVNFCETHHFFQWNSQFVKAPSKRWTYVSPNGQHYHELDHILCNRKAITDVGVVPSFNTGSDHRLLRARLHFAERFA